MPTYEYICGKCGHEFELFQRMTDPPRKRCPKCRGGVRRKPGTGAGLLFKGSGFYVTDYRSEGYRKAAGKEGSDRGAAKPAETKSGEAAPAKAPAAAPGKAKG
jgi:putative FmdB family regulatory protein